MQTVLILCPTFPPDINGLAGHTEKLCHTLTELGKNVVVVTKERSPETNTLAPWKNVLQAGRHWDLWHLWGPIKACFAVNAQTIIIPYTPLLWGGRGGLGPAPFLATLLLRLLTPARVLIFFHEVYAPHDGRAKTLFQTYVHRLRAGAMAAVAHASLVSCRFMHEQLDGLLLHKIFPKRIDIVPVGSNIRALPFSMQGRSAMRASWGVREGQLALGFFGGLHLSRKTREIVENLSRGQSPQSMPKLVFIGTDLQELQAELGADAFARPSEHLICTGKLPEEEVSKALDALDGLLSYFVDGVSARRGSVFAALEHGLPVLSTWGPMSDEFMKSYPGLDLVGIDRPDFQKGALAFMARLQNAPTQRTRPQALPWKTMAKDALAKAIQ